MGPSIRVIHRSVRHTTSHAAGAAVVLTPAIAAVAPASAATCATSAALAAAVTLAEHTSNRWTGRSRAGAAWWGASAAGLGSRPQVRSNCGRLMGGTDSSHEGFRTAFYDASCAKATLYVYATTKWQPICACRDLDRTNKRRFRSCQVVQSNSLWPRSSTNVMMVDEGEFPHFG